MIWQLRVERVMTKITLEHIKGALTAFKTPVVAIRMLLDIKSLHQVIASSDCVGSESTVGRWRAGTSSPMESSFIPFTKWYRTKCQSYVL